MRGAFDFETYEWTNPFFCGFAWGPPGERQTYEICDPARVRDGRKYDPDKVAEMALLFMWHTEEVTEWWAHNMGKFDGLFLVAAAQRLRWSVEGTVAGSSRIIQLKLRPPGQKRAVIVRDSFAVAPARLKDNAKDFELPSAKKIFTEDDYTKDPRTWPLEHLREGCIRDCILVLELLERLETLVSDWGGELKSTFSSSALSIVKAKLQERGEEIPSHKKLGVLLPSGKFEPFTWMNATAREGYYGGRVEVFHHLPQGTLTEWDVCSSYPWSMSQRLPWVPLGQANQRALDLLMSGELEGMVEARVTIPRDTQFPCLPFKPKTKGVFFPVGSWKAWFPAVELRYAMTQGVHVEPLNGLLYRAASPFLEFVEEVYSLKQTAKGAVRSFAKLVLNGGYGKFGQKPERANLLIFGDEGEALDYAAERPGRVSKLSPDWMAVAVHQTMWAHHAHFAVASYITALSRIKLHRAIMQSKGLAYGDTDSIHAKELRPSEHVQFGTGLGEWKEELRGYKATFYAPKIYRLTESTGKEHFAAKGFPVNAESFAKLIAGTEVHVERTRLIKSQLKANDKTTRRTNEEKVWRGLSGKRAPLPDGSTRPWDVKELRVEKHKQAVSPAFKRG